MECIYEKCNKTSRQFFFCRRSRRFELRLLPPNASRPSFASELCGEDDTRREEEPQTESVDRSAATIWLFTVKTR